MADPAYIDIVADRRVPSTGVFTFLDIDLTASALKVEVRLAKDTTVTPLIEGSIPDTLGIGFCGTDTIANHITAGRLSAEIYAQINPATGVAYVPADSVLLSQMVTFFDSSGFPIAEETGDDLTCYYDIIRTPPGGSPIDELLMRGKFIVRAGVTIP